MSEEVDVQTSSFASKTYSVREEGESRERKTGRKEGETRLGSRRFVSLDCFRERKEDRNQVRLSSEPEVDLSFSKPSLSQPSSIPSVLSFPPLRQYSGSNTYLGGINLVVCTRDLHDSCLYILHVYGSLFRTKHAKRSSGDGDCNRGDRLSQAVLLMFPARHHG